jgi:DNA polymerase-2
VSLWLKTDSGVVKLEIENELVVFFIEQSCADIARDLLHDYHIQVAKFQSLTLKTFNQQSVVAIYFTQMRTFYRARELLKRHDIKCYEDDIRPDDRYLMERHITADITYKIGNNKADQAHNLTLNNIKPNYSIVKYAKCKKSTVAKDVSLSMLSIDIECSTQGELYSIGMYANNDLNEFKRVLMIGDPQQCTDSYIEWLSDEKALLHRFIHEVTSFDADVFIGWNVVNFDLFLIQKRCDLYNVKFTIGRDGSRPYWRKNPNNNDQNFIEIAGRVVLDGIDLMKTATYSFPSFTLDYVSQTILGMKKKSKRCRQSCQRNLL